MIIAPIRLLQVTVTNVIQTAVWADSSNPSDPFLNYPYKWTVTLSVVAQPHSDPSTNTPYYYTGTDIVVGDWFSNAVGGAAWEIISITSATAGRVIAVVQDIDLLNTVSDPSGSAAGGPANLIEGFVFQIGEDGLPILAPITPLVITPQYQTDLISRFRSRNMIQNHYEVIQPGNTFTTGQLIALTSAGTYVLASSITSAIGVIRDVAVPETGYFTYRPIGPVIKNISPALPGSPGSLIYLDPTTPGSYTVTAPPGVQQPIFIQLETSSTGILLSRNMARADQPATIVLGAAVTLSAATHHKQILVCTIGTTISLPTPWPGQFSIIGDGFTCDVLNLSTTAVTFDNNMIGTTSIPPGTLARIVATAYQTTVFVSTGGASLAGPTSPVSGQIYTLQYLDGVISWVTAAAPILALSANSLTFPPTQVGSTAQVVLTITNNGSAPLIINDVTTTGAFTES
jgi:hypothetical protein